MESEESQQYQKNSSKIDDLSRLQPTELADKLAGQTELAGPTLGPAISATATGGLQYLNQKLPRPAAEFMGDEPWEPNRSAMQRFNDFHAIVHDPVSILHHVKEGTLTSDHMDALQQVYPKLLQHMQQEVAGQTTPKSIKDLPYHTKASLSRFLGQPLEASFVPRVALANQLSFAAQPGNQPQVAPAKPKRTSGKLGKIGLAQRSQTRTQGLEEQDD